jgi:hypothetical protein
MPGTASAIGFGDVSTEEAFTADPLYRSEAAGDSFAIEGHRLREHIPLRTRIVGLIGLVILVPLGAGLIGLAIYWVGHLARMVFERWSGAA